MVLLKDGKTTVRAMGALAMAQHAATRQALQTIKAVVIASIGLLAALPVAMLTRALVAFTARREIPLGEVPLLLIICVILLDLIEVLISLMISGRARKWLLVRVVVIQVGMWAIAASVAKQLGVRQIILGALPIFMTIFLLARPLAVFMGLGQTCAARVRRTVRELALGVSRMSGMLPGCTVILYVYLTVFTQLKPAVEVLVIGLAMPLLQAVCMTLLAWIMERQEHKVQTSMARSGQYKTARKGTEADDAGATSVAPEDGKVEPQQEEAESSQVLGTSAPAVPRKIDALSFVSLMMVFSVEITYSTGAFTTLALVESEGTFIMSLVSMLFIELAQVVVHVKAKRALSGVIAEATADTLLGDEVSIRHWLLYQELGEKIGVLVALGFLAIDKSLGRDVPAVQAIGGPGLARRGLLMLSMELVSDLSKDLVTQALGLIGPNARSGRVHLPPLGVAIGAATCLTSFVLVQIGMAFGTA